MEHQHTNSHAGPPEPSGSQVREHWATWKWFTEMTKIGIVVVAVIVAATTVIIVHFSAG